MNFLDSKITLPDFVPFTAWLEHGPFAMWLIRAVKPKSVVELGTHYGYSYFAMCQAAKEMQAQQRIHTQVRSRDNIWPRLTVL